MTTQRERVKWQHTRPRTRQWLLWEPTTNRAQGPNAESAGNPQSILMTHCERNRKHLKPSSAPVSFHQSVPPSFFTSSPHQSFPSPPLSPRFSAVLLGVCRFDAVDLWVWDSPSLVFPDSSDITRNFTSSEKPREARTFPFHPRYPELLTLTSPFLIYCH